MHTDTARILGRIHELEQEHQDDEGWLGVQWHEVPAPAGSLNFLVAQGLLRISFQSRKFTHYRLADTPPPGPPEAGAPGPTQAWPSDLFSVVVGHQDVINLLNLALAATRVHVLLAGPPATAKSLLLDEIARLPDSYVALGGTSSRPGLASILMMYRPRYLVLDELDKAEAQDLSILLRLMEHQELIYTKRGFTVREPLVCQVFAGANTLRGLPPELLDRFAIRSIPPYSMDEYREVVVRVLREREGCEEELARYIAGRLCHLQATVRDAVRVGRMARSVQEAAKVIGLLQLRALGG